jgi:hypothetical protein
VIFLLASDESGFAFAVAARDVGALRDQALIASMLLFAAARLQGGRQPGRRRR